MLVNAALLLPFALIAWLFNTSWHALTPHYFFAVNTGVSLAYILGGWWLESNRLADGGQALAKRIGAVPAQRLENNRGVASSKAAEIQFTNIVQEMAIAANMRAPAAFVLPRDGSIKEIKLLDLNGDKQPEVIVVVESAGSGSYLSADALTINPQEGLESFNHVEGLAPSDDVIEALKTPRD